MCLYTKKYQRSSCVFFTNHYISYQKQLNTSNYKTCLYKLFVYLYTKIPKILLCFFHKNTTFQRSSCVFFTKHYISYQKQLNPNNYKTCLYKLFVYLYTKIPKTVLCFFHKNTTFQKSSCVLTKHLNPSNYKTCLYKLFVYLYTKIPKTILCFFHKNTAFHIRNSYI